VEFQTATLNSWNSWVISEQRRRVVSGKKLQFSARHWTLDISVGIILGNCKFLTEDIVSARNLNFPLSFFKWRFSEPKFAFFWPTFYDKKIPDIFSTDDATASESNPIEIYSNRIKSNRIIAHRYQNFAQLPSLSSLDLRSVYFRPFTFASSPPTVFFFFSALKNEIKTLC